MFMKHKYKIGDFYTEEWIPSSHDLHEFSKLSGDLNPIHIDRNTAINLGYKDVVIHGNLTCAQISRVIGMNFPGNGSVILEQNISFTKPIYTCDKIKFTYTIISVNEFINVITIKIKAIKRDVRNKDNHITVLRGKILCQILEITRQF